LFLTVIATLVLVSAVDISYPLFSSYAIDHFVVPKSIDNLLAVFAAVCRGHFDTGRVRDHVYHVRR
jgi:hypothetical protein